MFMLLFFRAACFHCKLQISLPRRCHRGLHPLKLVDFLTASLPFFSGLFNCLNLLVSDEMDWYKLNDWDTGSLISPEMVVIISQLREILFCLVFRSSQLLHSASVLPFFISSSQLSASSHFVSFYFHNFSIVSFSSQTHLNSHCKRKKMQRSF